MKICQCAQCGLSEPGLVWGFALLARDGWGLLPATNPPGAAERAWLCTDCGARAESLARRLGGAPSSPPQRSAGTSVLKVLVVDDHELILRGMVRLLAGCETTLASSGQQAWALISGGRSFDVILSDVMMPEMSGPELYARCCELSPELGSRFVFASADVLTAQAMIEEAQQRVAATTAPPLLPKPSSREALLDAIAAVAHAGAHRSGTHVVRLPFGLASEGR